MLPLKIGQWRDKINTLSQPLRDPSHDFEIYQGKIEKNVPIPFDSIACTVSGEASIHLFNEDKDSDAGGVIGKASTNNKAGFVLGPAIIFNADNAWLKYSATASFKATRLAGYSA
jgi:hypothetical protein